MNSFLGVNRVAFSLGNFEVYWYGIIICSAIIVAIGLACFLAKKKGYPADMPLTIAIIILPAGILSARLFAVLFDSGLSITDYFNFRTGGMSIIGALIGGGLALLIYLLIKKEKDMFKYFDTLVVVLILAQAIGRWGNYFNEEIYGALIESDSFFARFPFAVKIDGNYYQALFFYESVLNLIGFAFLCQIYLGIKKSGYSSAFYLVYYGIVRTVLESFRNEQYVLRIFGLPVSQICSAIMIAFGIAIFIYKIVKSNKEKRRLVDVKRWLEK